MLKIGNWTKKVEVRRAVKSEALTINLISSEYGKLMYVIIS